MVLRNRNTSNIVRLAQIQEEVNEDNLKPVDHKTPIRVKVFAFLFTLLVVAIFLSTK